METSSSAAASSTVQLGFSMLNSERMDNSRLWLPSPSTDFRLFVPERPTLRCFAVCYCQNWCVIASQRVRPEVAGPMVISAKQSSGMLLIFWIASSLIGLLANDGVADRLGATFVLRSLTSVSAARSDGTA